MATDDGLIAPKWRGWIAQNLLRDVDIEGLIEALVHNEVPRDAAVAAVVALQTSPELQAARAELRRVRQQRMMFRLQRQLLTTASAPGEIIRRPALSGAEFFDAFYATNTPVVMEGFAADWPALERWRPEYFREAYGDVEVAVTTDRLSDPDYDMHTAAHTEAMTMANYIDRVLGASVTNDFYMVANNRNLEKPTLAPLMDDVVYRPDYFKPDGWRGCTALWIGPAGTVTPLHHDTCNILFVQLYGTKRFLLMSPMETRLLDEARSMYAGVDPESPEWETRCPDVAHKTVDLKPGEALFLPVGWWHHVRALDVSVSLACTHFVRPNLFDWYRPGAVQ